MKTKVNPNELSNELSQYSIEISMSDRAWFDLAFQKQALLKALASPELTRDEAEGIQGIIHLLDSIQDQAVNAGVNENIVFPIIDEV